MNGSQKKPMALCERCWLFETTKWEPQSVDEHGRAYIKIVGVALPPRISNPSVDECCMCGEITVVGIYVMRDPEMVPYGHSSEAEDIYDLMSASEEEEP
jgi:hypothetical protein